MRYYGQADKTLYVAYAFRDTMQTLFTKLLANKHIGMNCPKDNMYLSTLANVVITDYSRGKDASTYASCMNA